MKLLEIIKEGSLEEEYQRFCTVCRVHSKCDSKVDDGYLGTILFGELELPTALVDACFYEKVWSTVGPVKTEYGYHLVFIRQRTDPEKCWKELWIAVLARLRSIPQRWTQ